MSNSHNKFLRISGWICLIWWALDYYIKIPGLEHHEWMWVCSLYLLFLGVALVTLNSTLLLGTISFLAVTQPYYIIDFFSIAILHQSTLLTMNYAFVPSARFAEFLSSARHLYMLPLGFYALFLMRKIPKHAYLVAFVLAFTIVGISHLISNSDENLNCSVRACSPYLLGQFTGISYYIMLNLVLTPLTFLVIFITNKLMKRLQKEDLNHRKSERLNRIAAYIFWSVMLFMTLVYILAMKYFSFAVGIPSNPRLWF